MSKQNPEATEPEAPRRRRGGVRAAREADYRRRILSGATRVFAAHGYDDAKMEAIAAASELSLGTLYSVFPGKAHIFQAVHEAGDRELLRRGAEDVSESDDPLAAVLAGVRTYTEYFLDNPDFLRMHLREGATWGSSDAGAGNRARTEAWRRGVEMFGRSFARCIEAGVFVAGDPVLLARMMLAMQQVRLAHWIESGASQPPSEVVEEMVDQVKRSFCR